MTMMSSTQILNFVPLILFLGILYKLYSQHDGIYELGGFQFLNATAFFTKRYDFIQSHFNKSKQKMFRFRILQHQIVAVSGEAARKIFFNHKNLDVGEGYKILHGSAPRLQDINIDANRMDDVSWFNKTLLFILQKDRLTDLIPMLFADVDKKMSLWKDEGRINPFLDIYNLVFQLTVRVASCRELAENTDDVARLAKLYLDIQESSTPIALILPWFPSPSRKARNAATRGLFTIISDYVNLRKKSPTPSSDPIDLLIAEGHEEATIIQFIISVIFAGVLNTGVIACWILLYLDANPKWKQNVTDEINSLITKHTDTTSSDPLHKRLSAVPITAWEDEMPILELVLRETLRLTLNGTALRRNIIEDLIVYDKVVKKGAFMAYSLGDVHLDSDIYSDPYKFDPDRFLEGREEDKKGIFTYMGWGGGRHPCTGMKVAKLEIKIITALFLANFEYKLVDAYGNSPIPFPQLDRNDMQQARPLGDPCFLAYKRIAT